MAARPRRHRAQLPACYHEGYLEKRTFRDKTSRKLWACLCGNALFFFNTSTENEYIEKIDLSNLTSVTDDCSRDRNLEAGRLNLHLKEGDVKITVPSLEARELWKGYILSVWQLSVPSSLNLLPGQIHMMREVVESEKQRRRSVPTSPLASNVQADAECPFYVAVLSDMPACFRRVSRSEAEVLLDRYPEHGNMLLRPGRDGESFAVTTRQDLSTHANQSDVKRVLQPVFRHYRVTRKHEGGFAIDVEHPILCSSLHDVINYLFEKTSGALKPFIMDETYEKKITYVHENEESGEQSVQSVVTMPRVPPKPEQKQRLQCETENMNFYLNEPRASVSDEDQEVAVMKPPSPQARTRKESSDAPCSGHTRRIPYLCHP
ncbi:signal-transducing adaptor protein 2b isoform X2 [Denticeps clupeoides]|uniref:signal-transducing adaptor protein 2b isoform X2 n=1 Tax=Denticeps clupeoides TaxID=299321 RepID=UPI0010A30D7E|nr:signal-transducing adaptor protein 1-like isoform X2 [Denticeps clupeoides]